MLSTIVATVTQVNYQGPLPPSPPMPPPVIHNSQVVFNMQIQEGYDDEIGFFEVIRPYSKIKDKLEEWSKSHPQLKRILLPDKSYENEDLYIYRLQKDAVPRPILVVQAVTHSNEWAAAPSGIYIINQLLFDSEAQKILDTYDVVVTPIANVDGYQLTWSDWNWRAIALLSCRRVEQSLRRRRFVR